MSRRVAGTASRSSAASSARHMRSSPGSSTPPAMSCVISACARRSGCCWRWATAWSSSPAGMRRRSRRRHRRGIHVPPRQGLRLLPAVHARRRCDRRRDDARADARGRGFQPVAAHTAGRRRRRRSCCATARQALISSSPRRRLNLNPRRPARTTSRCGSSRPGRPAGRRRACTGWRRRCAASSTTHGMSWRSRGRRRAARAEALLRVRARPRGSVPVRGRGRGHRLPGEIDRRPDLRADRARAPDDPRQRPDDDPLDAGAAPA